MHVKMLQNKSINIIQLINHKLGKKWPQFINNLKRSTDKDDSSLIYIDHFFNILATKYDFKLSEDDLRTLLNGFPAKSTEKKQKLQLLGTSFCFPEFQIFILVKLCV